MCLRAPLLVGLLWGGGFTFFTPFFGVYLKNRFGFSQSSTGDFFAIVGLFIAIMQGLVVGLISKQLSDHKVLRFSLFGQAAVMAVSFAAHTTTPLYMVIPLFALFQGWSQANLGALISRSAEPGHQGEAIGIYSSMSSLAQVPASALVGYITGSITSNTPIVVA